MEINLEIRSDHLRMTHGGKGVLDRVTESLVDWRLRNSRVKYLVYKSGAQFFP